MTAAREAAEQLMQSEHADVLRESVAGRPANRWKPRSPRRSAELGERAPEELHGAQRNGYRPRRWDTRVGQLELAIPKVPPVAKTVGEN